MRVPTVRPRAAGAIALLTLGVLAVGVPGSAHAAGSTSSRGSTGRPAVTTAGATAATNGKIAYACLGYGPQPQNGWVVADSNGANKVFTPWTQGEFEEAAQWSPDGTEMVHSAAFPGPPTAGFAGVALSEADGSYPWRVTNFDNEQGFTDDWPAWVGGRAIAFTRVTPPVPFTFDLRTVASTGSTTSVSVATAALHGDARSDGSFVFIGSGGTIEYAAPQSAAQPIGRGTTPKLSPDGALVAYSDPITNDIHTVAVDGTHDLVAGHAQGQVRDLAWSPDGTSFLFSTTFKVWEQPVGGAPGTATEVGGSECASVPSVSWQPVPATPASVVRMAGTDRVGTSVAVSKQSIALHTADAVVLANSTNFPDALAGAPLADAVHGPLLLTMGSRPTADTRVVKEMTRALKLTAKQVYLVGGPGSLSPGIEQSLRTAGYGVTRLWGQDRYQTALTIAQHISTLAGAPPSQIFLATGTNFPDGLSAGAAAGTGWGKAGSTGGVVLLTSGGTMPPGVQAYIDDAIAHWAGTATPAQVWSVGGPAAQAYSGPNETELVGSDRYATSELVARTIFGPAQSVALATGTSFPDALSGGAYAGSIGAPLLLAPASLTTTNAVPTYLHTQSAAIDSAYIFGGTGVVSATVETDLGKIIALSATHTLVKG